MEMELIMRWWYFIYQPFKLAQQKISRVITTWLTSDITPPPQDLLYSFEQICYQLKPGDIILADGRTRVSEVIKIITQSRWSHAAIYIGRPSDIQDPELREK